MKTLLIFSDGYSINYEEFASYEDAKEHMDQYYKNTCPEQNDPKYADMSYLGSYDAILHRNGENVYLWKIIL